MSAAPFVEGPLREAMRQLFNSDLTASETAVAAYRRDVPEDPLGSAIAAAVRFYHYVSMRIPERDTPSIVGVLLGSGVPMPAAMQKEIGASLRLTQKLAGAADNVNSILRLMTLISCWVRLSICCRGFRARCEALSECEGRAAIRRRRLLIA